MQNVLDEFCKLHWKCILAGFFGPKRFPRKAYLATASFELVLIKWSKNVFNSFQFFCSLSCPELHSEVVQPFWDMKKLLSKKRFQVSGVGCWLWPPNIAHHSKLVSFWKCSATFFGVRIFRLPIHTYTDWGEWRGSRYTSSPTSPSLELVARLSFCTIWRELPHTGKMLDCKKLCPKLHDKGQMPSNTTKQTLDSARTHILTNCICLGMNRFTKHSHTMALWEPLQCSMGYFGYWKLSSSTPFRMHRMPHSCLEKNNWTIEGDSMKCFKDKAYTRDVKLTGCSREGQFTCDDGQCVKMSEHGRMLR